MTDAEITGIGSLPHTDPDAAATFVLATTSVPYLPQLPRRHAEEGMLLQWGDGVCGCGFDPAAPWGLRHGAPPGPRHEAFVGAAALARRGPFRRLKTQATGPITLAMALLAAGHPSRGIWDCVVPELVGRIEAHVEGVEADEVILVLDEPALGMYADSADLPMAWGEAAEVLDSVMTAVAPRLGGRPGIHCCAETEWGRVAALRPGYLSWDVMTLSGGLAEPDPVSEAVAAGTQVMWGIVPADPNPVSVEQAVAEIYRSVVTQLVVSGAPIEHLGRWFTPACGLAGLEETQAEWVMERVAAWAGELAVG